jgi:hypothetical protein
MLRKCPGHAFKNRRRVDRFAIAVEEFLIAIDVQRQAHLLRVDALSASLCGTGGLESIPPVFPPTNYFQCGGNKTSVRWFTAM